MKGGERSSLLSLAIDHNLEEVLRNYYGAKRRTIILLLIIELFAKSPSLSPAEGEARSRFCANYF